ncbi:cell wall-binding repeat-containing protein [Leifsonia sp. NPDC058292]|uniref:cell wall-binding repeat-containing protein n=1 Tax=Leifsonia sp. NPDC058292 TaxID=3346428 RepID=UPI0036D909E2
MTVGALVAVVAVFSGVTTESQAAGEPPILRGGQPIGGASPDGEPGICAITATGYKLSDGASQALTAGWCKDRKVDTTAAYELSSRPVAGGSATSTGVTIGDAVVGTGLWQPDGIGLIDASSTATSSAPEALTWGNGAGAPLATAPQIVRDVIAPEKGQTICKSADMTGWTCGKILDVVPGYAGEGMVNFEQIVTDLCSTKAEMGGPGFVGNSLVGMVVGATWADSCATGDQTMSKPYTSFLSFRSSAGRPSALSVLNNLWEPAVKVEPVIIPAATSNGNVVVGSELSGALPFGGPNHTVTVTLAGVPNPLMTTVSATGSWSISTNTLAPGIYGYSAVASWGKWSKSTPVTGNLTVAATDRIWGVDRFEGAAAQSRAAYPDTAPVVYVSSGVDFPDALSAGPAAAKFGGPLLTTNTDALPAVVKAEIDRLHPNRIVIVGGEAVVTPGVAATLGTIAPVTRIAGADRFVVSRTVAASFGNVSTAYVANGMTFPDALSAGAAAAARRAPIILVNGGLSSIDAATIGTLTSLGVTKVKIVGGIGAVSAGIEAGLSSSFTVERLGGPQRQDTSRIVNDDYFLSATSAYIATSLAFPDALTGAVLAGKNNAPLYLVPGTCIPAETAMSIAARGVTSVTTLGGPAAMTDPAKLLVRC